MVRKRLAPALIALALALGLGPGAWAAPPSSHGQCFLSRDWNGWRATPDSKSIYIRVGVSRFFRLDLASACPLLRAPTARLITRVRGSSWICHPIDLDLKVSDGHGISTSCLVSSITPLTRKEAAALPPKLRP